MFEKAEKILSELDSEIKSKFMRDASLVVVGQRMSNLLEWFMSEIDDDSLYDPEMKKKCNEASELILRWNKEFN